MPGIDLGRWFPVGWFSRTFGLDRQPRNDLTIDEFMGAFASSYASSTGIAVNSDSALASVAVLACILVRAESLMFCPVDVYRRTTEGRKSADDHPVAALVGRDPNQLLTSQEFWRWKQIREDLTGNAYVRIERQGGRPVALWPMYGGAPTMWRGKTGPSTGSLPAISYQYVGDDFTPAGLYPAVDIIHFRGPLLAHPDEGRSLVQATAQNIGLDLASAEFFARFLSNGSHFPNYFETDSTLSKEDLDSFGRQFRDGAGLLPAGKLRIFDRGLKLQQNQMSLKDADLSGHQRWILEQVCRTWRVPLPMVQDLTHGTYTNSEQADLWLSKYTLAPIAVNTESRARKSLFLGSEKDMYLKFNLGAMMRGDFQVRTAGYSLLINCGVMCPNEARAMEDWNPYDGGDEYRVPLNTGPASGAADVAMSAADVAARVNAYGTAFRSGVTPESGAPAAGLEGLAFTGETPVTTKAALDPLLADARDRVLARHGDNLARGRAPEETVRFAGLVLAPIVATARNLGVDLDPGTLAESWVGYGRDGARL